MHHPIWDTASNRGFRNRCAFQPSCILRAPRAGAIFVAIVRAAVAPRGAPGKGFVVTPAKRIANAIARSGVYHKRSALLAALIALGSCVAVLVLDQTAAKALSLCLAIVFGFSAFRSLRRANRYFGLQGSPVLEAITQSPRRIAAVRPSEESGARTVVVVDTDGNQLALRAGDGDDREALLEAFREHAPLAKIEGAVGAPPPGAGAKAPPGGHSSSTARTSDG
jgi:hypothetical protein